MAMFRHWALEKGLKPSETGYVRRARVGTVDLRFSKSGDPDIEEELPDSLCLTRTLGAQATADREEAKPRRPAQPVFLILRDSQCSECGAEIAQGSLLLMEAGQPLCLPCARLDDLEYLP